MIIEYNKFNVILYFLVGTTIIFATKRYIYGALVLLLSVVILFQRLILRSDNPILTKYQNVTGLGGPLIVILLVLVSVFILYKSSIENGQKLFSLLFMIFALGFSFYKRYFKDDSLFKLSITNYIGTLLFMITLLTVTVIPDNQYILESKYREIKNKLSNKPPINIT